MVNSIPQLMHNVVLLLDYVSDNIMVYQISVVPTWTRGVKAFRIGQQVLTQYLTVFWEGAHRHGNKFTIFN